jgi:hypothetical protein
VMGASLCAGFRWACSQLLLSGSGGASGSKRTPQAGETELGPVAEQGATSSQERDALQQILPSTSSTALPHETKTLHRFALVYATAIFGNVILIPTAIAIEGRAIRAYATACADEPALLLAAACLTMVGGFAAFVMLVAELRVVSLTSGLTLSVVGVLKEVLTVLASVIVLGEALTADKALGLSLCVVGLALYVHVTFGETKTKPRQARLAAEQQQGQAEPSAS